jgi:hypothetical protein
MQSVGAEAEVMAPTGATTRFELIIDLLGGGSLLPLYLPHDGALLSLRNIVT